MNEVKSINFSSCLSELILGFIAEKRAVGYKFIKGASLLKQLDQFLATEQQLTEINLSKETVLLWTKKRAHEKENTRSKRISIIRGLAEYMVRLGYDAYIYPASAIKINRYDYTPYIFSKEEIRKIFSVCDCYPTSTVSPNRHRIIPLLFRMLYGCGLRISEAVNLTLDDVNLERGTLIIRETKFDKERIIPMAESLSERCREYMEEVHSFNEGATFLFPSPYGGHYREDTVYNWFRGILWKAGISHSGEGPRLHDLRHTFSVHCLKRWVLNGENLTNLLPYLSVYLGHVDLRGTQRYLRLTADLYPSIIESVEKHYSDLIPEVFKCETD
jgi:integrase